MQILKNKLVIVKYRHKNIHTKVTNLNLKV